MTVHSLCAPSRNLSGQPGMPHGRKSLNQKSPLKSKRAWSRLLRHRSLKLRSKSKSKCRSKSKFRLRRRSKTMLLFCRAPCMKVSLQHVERRSTWLSSQTDWSIGLMLREPEEGADRRHASRRAPSRTWRLSATASISRRKMACYHSEHLTQLLWSRGWQRSLKSSVRSHRQSSRIRQSSQNRPQRIHQVGKHSHVFFGNRCWRSTPTGITNGHTSHSMTMLSAATPHRMIWLKAVSQRKE
mmetsp:Transcript_96778/g.171380  ORF Transcript_96778/g.171380 Transcript_96778/m.171380 type:complete len:241 (-) Transcript_96778:1931-2653(-)